VICEGTGNGRLPVCFNGKLQSLNHRHTAKNVGKMMQGFSKYLQAQEQAKSSIKEAVLKTAVSTGNIRSERQLLINRLEHRFRKRQDLYKYHINLIDAALEMQNELQNEQIIRAIAENILNVYQDNLKQGAKDFRQRFGALHDEVYI
jgi:hypothetical protein